MNYLSKMTALILSIAVSVSVAQELENPKAVVDAQEINQHTLWPKPKNPIAVDSEHSSALKVVQGFFNAYGTGAMQALASFVAVGVGWHFPGRAQLAGPWPCVKPFAEFFYTLAGGR